MGESFEYVRYVSYSRIVINFLLTRELFLILLFTERYPVNDKTKISH